MGTLSTGDWRPRARGSRCARGCYPCSSGAYHSIAARETCAGDCWARGKERGQRWRRVALLQGVDSLRRVTEEFSRSEYPRQVGVHCVELNADFLTLLHAANGDVPEAEGHEFATCIHFMYATINCTILQQWRQRGQEPETPNSGVYQCLFPVSSLLLSLPSHSDAVTLFLSCPRPPPPPAPLHRQRRRLGWSPGKVLFLTGRRIGLPRSCPIPKTVRTSPTFCLRSECSKRRTTKTYPSLT